MFSWLFYNGVSVVSFLIFIIFHFLLYVKNPIFSLFGFLFFILLEGVILLLFGYSYISFVLISVYGGAIVVLFLLVSMLFNKKVNLISKQRE